jgi:DNA-binding transcriptional LysR family regulator
MTVELREVRTFLVLAEELHFSRTAQRLHVAQSAVSHTIKRLETELGTALFLRGKGGVSLTHAGERFRERARQSLQLLEQASDSARRVGTGEAGRLVLSFTLMSWLTVVPRALARFHARYPNVELEIGSAGSKQQLEAIRTGRCDIGFMPKRKEMGPLATEFIHPAPLVALLPTHHRLCKRKIVPLAGLAKERFVFLKLENEPKVRESFRARCLQAGFEPNIAFEVEQLEVLLAAVAAGLGVSCVPDLVRMLQFPGVAMIPLSPVVEAGISAVWDPRLLSPAGHNFLSILRAERDSNAR